MTALPTSDGRSEPFATGAANPTIPVGAQSGAANFRTSVISLDRPGDPAVFDTRTRAEAAELIARYPEGQSRSALLPMLHLVQSVQGHVTPDGIAFCADTLGLTKAQVSAVATFYTMYKRSPTGEYLVSVCTNTLCGMLGGDEIFATLRETLGLGNSAGAHGSGGAAAGEDTTADGRITLEHAECLAACDYAPVVTVNYEFFDNQSPESAIDLVGRLQGGERPLPTRGAPLCTFKQISRQIAGFFDAETLAPDAVSSGVPTEIGVRLAIQRGDTPPSYAARDSRSSGAAAAERASSASGQQPTSEHDAPLSTSASDPSHAQGSGAGAEAEPGDGKDD
ncbi:MAG: NADH-quinone oxidoreductase subunit [Pseudonocardiales bacterium]|jgi:NADH-quinone oxidoreductase subunit E|nr:NADH-quinone oxidoreductase subunit [Pseudonocardiales bacterium]